MYYTLKHWRHFKLSNRYIYRFAIVTLLYAITNGMVSFVLPVILEEKIQSLTLVGFILAFSSIWNIVTDFILGFMKKPPTYRLLMQLVGLSLFVFFGGIWLFDTVPMLIIASALWGIFTELYSFANFDFVINTCDKTDRGLHFGLLSNFRSLGYTLAPIIAGSVIILGHDVVMSTGLFFTVCILLLFNLQIRFKRLPKPEMIEKRNLHFITEIKMWWRIGGRVLPLLSVTLVQGIADGVLTSFTPIFVESVAGLKLFGGLIIALQTLPVMLFSGYCGHLSDTYGRKKFILLGLLVSAVSLLFFGYTTKTVLAGILAFMIGCGYSLYTIALSAEQSDYVAKHHTQENEVVSESGIFYNFGFIVGAALTGILVTILGGFGPAFAILGITYGVALGIYWFFGPRKYSLKDGIII